MAKGIIIAAPSSGSGKTVVTLAILSALRQSGMAVAAGKVGPDYIDPAFHSRSTERPCLNLDMWAMRPQTLNDNCKKLATNSDLVVIEGVMGLFDGPETGTGSTADLAANLGLPVVLVVDCSHQAQSIAALVVGFARFRSDINVAGVILNRVSSDRHIRLLSCALEAANVPVIGTISRLEGLELPSRHLGLVQAGEHGELNDFITNAGKIAARNIDLEKLTSLAATLPTDTPAKNAGLPPLGQHVAIARDAAFGFTYPHHVENWRKAGATISFFSPLNNEAPPADADAIFLPGGYPELHAAKLAANTTFMDALRNTDSLVYGECGGYMVLGEGLIDKNGERHKMAGLLPVTTSFAQRKLALGYRKLSHTAPLPWPQNLAGHEFHFSILTESAKGTALFTGTDTNGDKLEPMGLQVGKVMGSYIHIIDEAAP